MQNEPTNKPVIVFDEKRASSYDSRADKAAPMMDALRFLTRLVLAELPDEARIICVGVGTGSELIDLAQANPGWRFTAVEPAGAMMAVCRRRAEDSGIADRCTFHEGYLDTLPLGETGFDAATCFLVSHFFVDPNKRSNFFAQIAQRLKERGMLVSADLSADTGSVTVADLREVWVRMLKHSDTSDEDIEKYLASWGKTAAVLPAPQVEKIIVQGGFETPVLFFQTLFIHGWYARHAV